jgi:hypothetical protein
MPVIPATQEAVVEGWQSRPYLCKRARPYLKNKLKAKGLGYGSSGRALA